MLDHGALTDLVISRIEDSISSLVTGTAKPLVGDGAAPDDGGWLQGQPGDGVFRPYVVVVSGGGAPRYQDLSSFSPQWAVSYSLRSFGGSRKQCDWMAHLSRQAILTVVGGNVNNWSIIGLEWASLGPVSRQDATAPPTWQVFDNVTLVVSS
jgi:hypothetical protein